MSAPHSSGVSRPSAPATRSVPASRPSSSSSSRPSR
jgi:hypothetical protein